jgi:hypothetical protein
VPKCARACATFLWYLPTRPSLSRSQAKPLATLHSHLGRLQHCRPTGKPYHYHSSTIPSNLTVGQLLAWFGGHTRSILPEIAQTLVSTLIDLLGPPSPARPSLRRPQFRAPDGPTALIRGKIWLGLLAPDAGATAGPVGTRSRCSRGSWRVVDVVNPPMWGGAGCVVRAENIGLRPLAPFVLPRTCCPCIIDSLRGLNSSVSRDSLTRNFSVGFHPIDKDMHLTQVIQMFPPISTRTDECDVDLGRTRLPPLDPARRIGAGRLEDVAPTTRERRLS